MYTLVMDVAVSSFRANLRHWLDRARAGDDVVVTDRGNPVARLIGVDQPDLINRLERDGLISRPAETDRPRATGRRRVTAGASVSEVVSEQRN